MLRLAVALGYLMTCAAQIRFFLEDTDMRLTVQHLIGKDNGVHLCHACDTGGSYDSGLQTEKSEARFSTELGTSESSRLESTTKQSSTETSWSSSTETTQLSSTQATSSDSTEFSATSIETRTTESGSTETIVFGSTRTTESGSTETESGSTETSCGCKSAHFGCCPDNLTIALGPNNEGCGCQYTQFGCCPDRRTKSQGPEFEGCACHTYQFGCCADGVTAATGPNLQGCLCQYSKYGCCGDEATAAKGPNKEGCDCSNSKFGCCPDGVTDAKGEKFLNCSDVPESKQAACALPNEKGQCRNFSVYWFYDVSYGGCVRFWYGGCEGNGNRFSSQEECEDVCVRPPPKDSCNLPKVKGICEGYNIRWYYDASREQCSQFVYGGCRGNSNNFDSQALCQERCEPEKTEEPSETEVSCDGFEAECAALRCEYGVFRKRMPGGCERCECVRVEVDCEPLRRECDMVKCNYGVERTTGDNGCERCRCLEHPCLKTPCTAVERCVATIYRHPLTLEVWYSAECKIVNKTGTCPPKTVYSTTEGQCRMECRDDADCVGVGKCCEHGCSRLCLEPASLVQSSPAPPHTTFSPDLPYAPRPSEQREPEVRAQEGGKATLRCFLHGNPPPRIIWRYGEITIEGDFGRYRMLSDGALKIVSLYRNDTGVYTCVAYNGLGIATQEIRLEVLVPLRTRITTDRTRLSAGSEINLSCDVEGFPVPEVYWTKDGVQIQRQPADDRIYVTEARLTITRANTNDSGVYGCHADNEYTSDYYSTVQISVEGLYIPASCKDNPHFANCNLIVKKKFCHHKYYGPFCCKSCVEAGQLDPNELELMQADMAWRRK